MKLIIDATVKPQDFIILRLSTSMGGLQVRNFRTRVCLKSFVTFSISLHEKVKSSSRSMTSGFHGGIHYFGLGVGFCNACANDKHDILPSTSPD